MSQELHYTSVARGLKPGTRGFGTVAATANLPETLAERLEGLSAYRAVYPPGDPSAALNPVAYVHVRLTVGNHPVDALSRIGPAGLDYSGRPNKYAHHVVLEPPERPEGGPAWLLSQPGFLRDAWEGEPRILPGGPPVPRGDRPASIAQSWLALTGDAGWAGVLAESFLTDPRRPVFLVYRPGTELLPLFVEAIALLPVSRRWDVEFSTYLTNLPPGVSCTWRGVLEGSAEAKNARRLPNALILDLCRPAGRAQGGALVHLARTGERLDIPDDGVPASTSGRLGSRRPSSVSAGPPPHPRTSGRGDHPPDAHGEGDGLPDLAARLGLDVSSLGDDRPRGRRRSRTQRAALAIAACLVPLFAMAFYSSPTFRRQLGLDRGASLPSAANPGAPPAARPDSPLRVAAKDGGARLPNGPAPAGGPAEPSPTEATAGKAPGPGGGPPVEKKPEAKADAPPEVHPKPDRPPAEPRIFAFKTPDVPRSSFSPAQQDRVLQLPEEAEEPIELRNGAGFRLNAVSAAHPTWEITTRTGSVVGGGSSLARLSRVDARTWRFDWTEKAKTQSSQVVESLKDAILEFGARDRRPIYVLLRGLVRRVERPLEVWTNQQILFGKLDPRTRPVEWAVNPPPDAGLPRVLEGTQWKPRIRRWKLVISRPETDPGDDDTPGWVVEPTPAEGRDGAGGDVALERDLIPGEVKVKLKIDPSTPGSIHVSIEPDPEKVKAGRAQRSARLNELKKDSPKEGDERDPLASRRARLGKLREGGAKDQEQMKTLEREIAELERINEILGREDLLTRPANVTLSVVIGLDVDGPGILDIVRIGDFAGGP